MTHILCLSWSLPLLQVQLTIWLYYCNSTIHWSVTIAGQTVLTKYFRVFTKQISLSYQRSSNSWLSGLTCMGEVTRECINPWSSGQVFIEMFWFGRNFLFCQSSNQQSAFIHDRVVLVMGEKWDKRQEIVTNIAKSRRSFHQCNASFDFCHLYLCRLWMKHEICPSISSISMKWPQDHMALMISADHFQHQDKKFDWYQPGNTNLSDTWDEEHAIIILFSASNMARGGKEVWC